MNETVVDISTEQAIGFGIKLYAGEDKKRAEEFFKAALHSDPGNFAAQFWIGICAFDRGDLYEALYRFDRALKVKRKDPVVRSNRGMVLSELGHLDEAEAELRLALHHDAKAHIAKVNLANVLVRMDRFQEGLQMATEAIESDPNDGIGYFNRGIARYSLDDVEGAIADFDEALSINPLNAEATYNRANALMKVGRLKEGFRDYDARLHTTQAGNYYYFEPTAPWWKGEDIAGKTLLIHGEQGIGDSIQFMRYVEVIAEKYRDAKIILVPHTALLSMCQARWSCGNVTVHPAADKPYPEHDFYTYLMSLPGIVGIDIDNIPEPWTPTEPWGSCDICDRWDRRIPPSGVNIGICWSGNTIHKNDSHRSMTLGQFAPIIAANPWAKFHCLQREIRPVDRDLVKNLGIETYCDDLTDMRETTHLVGKMDLVITVDTAVAHLAATMCELTWIMLPKFRTDWRWMMKGDTTPWYPSVKLFRQFKAGDWLPVTTWIARDLGKRQQIAA